MSTTRKQPVSRQRIRFEEKVTETLEAQDRMLEHLAEKLEKPVLNGGFDRLVASVQKIEMVSDQLQESQIQLRESQASAHKKIDAIHTVVLDPDTGLYHKVKSNSQWIDNASKGLKWFVGLLVAGLLGGAGKLLYDMLSSHIHVAP